MTTHEPTASSHHIAPLPPSLPPLPEGAVYLGRGGTFKTAGHFFNGWCSEDGDKKWGEDDGWGGTAPDYHYAAPADSEIVKLNRKPAATESPLLLDDSMPPPNEVPEGWMKLEGEEVIQKHDLIVDSLGTCNWVMFSIGSLASSQSNCTIYRHPSRFPAKQEASAPQPIPAPTPAPTTPLKRFWMVLRVSPSGTMQKADSIPTYRHDTEESAIAEARRLSDLHPNALGYAVLCSTQFIITTKTTTTYTL